MSFAGVPLSQLAHVAAAQAEGFSLAEILAVEGLAVEELRAADVACKEMLCNPEAGPRLFAAYASAQKQAEELLTRRVQPLDEDLGAWVHFLAMYAASEDPRSILQDLGLTLPDLARLGRAWKQRFEADRELARRAEKLARAGDRKVALPVLRIEPAKLVPSPHARPKPVPPSPNAPALSIRSKVRDVPPAISGTALSLDVPRGPALPFVEGPDVGPPEPLRLPVDAPPRAALSGTTLSLDVPRGPGLPFVDADLLSFVNKRTAARVPVELSGTALALDVPRGPALPFVETQEPAAQPPPTSAIELPQSPRVAISGTALALDVPRSSEMPFVGTDATSKASHPAVVRAPVELSGTALALDVPRGPALPFVETQEPAAQPSPTSAIELSQSPRAAISGTALALDVPRGTDMPFDDRKNSKELASTQLLLEIPRELVRRPLPSSAPAPPELPPKLTLEEHAALTVELAMSPERSAEVLARYRITQADREALDRLYQAIVSADERKRGAWHDAYKAHYARIASILNRR
ncbi:hypothetical protein KEG38_39560 [Polyangium jinanense]|uniref:hypothetical protein n=1 Tax=Polyangium jinanense TaxID=2829994 RepID=UPI0023411CA9|nr:hypothetical protein [Polyangium jinanense]MDC3960019.1 hypothetical protein [Polyangium jinanense]